jgi:hypothetical protein
MQGNDAKHRQSFMCLMLLCGLLCQKKLTAEAPDRAWHAYLTGRINDALLSRRGEARCGIGPLGHPVLHPDVAERVLGHQSPQGALQ